MIKKEEISKAKSLDTANKRKKEEKLRNGLFLALAEQTSDIIVLINREGIITYENPAADILGVSAEKRIGTNVFERIHPDDLKTIKDSFNILLSDSKAPPQKAEVRLCCTDGSWRMFEIIGNHLVHDNVVESLVVNLRDITERKKMEKELLFIKKAVESSSDAIGISTPQGHHFYHNKAFTDLFEYTPEELEAAGGGPAAFVDKKVAREVFDSIMGGKSWNSEVKMISKSGRKIPIIIRADAIKDENGKIVGLIGVHTDITERKKAESQREAALEALMKSEKYFKEITENSSDIFIITDKNGDIKYCSRSIERFTGYKPEELIGKSVFNFIHLDEVNRAVDDYGKAILAKDTTLIPNAFRVVHKDGSEVYLDGLGRNLLDNPDVAGFVMNVRDITERKRAEENLFKSERKFSLIFHLNPNPMAISEIVTSKFIDANQAFIHWTGFSREEIIGTSAQDLHLWVNPEDQEKIAGAFTLTGEVNGSEMMIRQKNGDIRNVLFTVRFIEIEQERYLLTLAHDITEHKNTENDLKRFAENLEDANIALRVLMNQRNEDQKEFEEKLQVNINDLVIPYLEKLKRANLDDRNKNYVSVLEYNLGEILSPFMRNFRSSHKNLTPKEIQIVDLIAKGKNTKEIADLLNTSISTITTHRNNIRKKLNLINSKINFRSYILSLK